MKKKHLLLGIIGLLVVLGLVIFYNVKTTSFLSICKKTSSKQICICVEKHISEDLKKSLEEAFEKVKNNEEAPLKKLGLHGMIELGEAYNKCGNRKQKNTMKNDTVVKDLKNIAINEAELAKIKIGNPKVKIYKGKYVWDNKTIIAFDIENGTNEPISNVGFHAVLVSEGRQIPWLEDDFSYDFAGGLNPKEKQHLNLRPNIFSEWEELENRKDYKLILEVIRVKGAGGSILWER